jgi:hypothetical protein
VHYIVGVPGETRTQINKTLEFATMLFEMHGAWPLLQHAIPFPGTRLWQDCEEQGWFVAPPFEIPGELLEVESIIRTPQFEPQEVIRMKRNAQHLHAAMQSLVYLEVDSRPRQELSAAMDRARFLGGAELFLGGEEPTAREDLAELIEEGRGKGFRRVTLVADSLRLEQAQARKLVDAGLDGLVVGLHGPAASVHDAVVGAQGAFEGTLRGISQALDHGCKSLEVQVAVTRANLSTLRATAELALKLRASKVHLQLPTPDSRQAKAGQVPSWQEARDALVHAVRAARRGVVVIQGVPLCLLADHPGAISPSPPWMLQRLRPHKVKHPECKECVGYILCGGPYRPEHDGIYGMIELIRNPSHR